MNQKKGIAIVPGSFDPITVGHFAIIEKAAQMYETVYVAVMINDQKRYMFSLNERTDIAKACVAALNNVSVISSEGMLWKLAKSKGACAIVKGYRNQTDIEYERKMAEFNKAYYPECETVLVKAENNMLDISSTAVRARILSGETLDGLVPEKSIKIIETILKKR